MATLVFGALGTLVGGPVGGAIGALLGRETDRAIFGTPSRDGPRLRELAASSSSYGQPIARLFGATRAAGTILWATELKESRDRIGGGKGRPATNAYSYSVSLAIALSSRPIEGIGRIWADGNLLRGVAGDLKTGGTLRIHLGHADQPRDPLLAAALGAQCPAHRGLAYVVFEDLQLADFGNRIPALSFEVFADGAGEGLVPALVGDAAGAASAHAVAGAAAIAGFAYEGGSLASAIALLAQAIPIAADAAGEGVIIGSPATIPVALSEPIAAPDGEFGARTGARHHRAVRDLPSALRHYDSARDYQPGLQRAGGQARGGGERVLELPATLSAAAARALIETMRLRASTAGERMQLRVASLDPGIVPGALVELPGAGAWRVEAWEWRSGGVELELSAVADMAPPATTGDPGNPWRPADRIPAATVLAAFELPWDGTGAADAVRIHVALGAGEGRWAGASIHAERQGALHYLATAGPARSVTARLARPLPGSPALMFEPRATIELICDDPDAAFFAIDGAALAAGGNRLLIGEEIVQFMRPLPLGAGRWRIEGLLRGRGASEAAAWAGHPAGTLAVALDQHLLVLDGAVFDPAADRLAAIGLAEAEPVFASVTGPGRSRRPLTPVHPIAVRRPSGALSLSWTRRARGAWEWRDWVEVPLVEEREAYAIGAGRVTEPIAAWTSDRPAIELSAETLSVFPAGTPLWVRQVGTHAASAALLLCTLS